MSDQEITICYLDSPPARIDIEDVDVELLVEHFNLAFKPSFLVRHEEQQQQGRSRKLIPIGRRNKLVPGCTYHIMHRYVVS